MKRLPVRLMREAEDDLDETWYFVAKRDGVERADHLVQLLRDATGILGEIPGIGKRNPRRPATRLYPKHNYVFSYRVTPEQVEVLHIVHGARDLGAILNADD